MKAAVCKTWGKPSDLAVTEVESRPPGAGEVQIAIHACGVNFADILMIAGQYQVKPPLPFAPGFEIAGEVLACGPGVNHFKPGDRVMGVCDYGGYAEQVTASVAGLVPLPDGMSYEEAGAFPVAMGTAHLGLTHRAGLKAGETLLVHGAAGGVGLAAVQVGHKLGATVIATASTAEKLQVAAEYGATHLINYAEEDFRSRVKELTGGRGADVIFDPVGGKVFEQSLRCINWEGRLLVIGFASGEIPKAPVNLLLVKNCSVVGFYWGAYGLRDPETMRRSVMELLQWQAEGALRAHVHRAYPLGQAAEAMGALLSREVVGKVVIMPQV